MPHFHADYDSREPFDFEPSPEDLHEYEQYLDGITIDIDDINARFDMAASQAAF